MSSDRIRAMPLTKLRRKHLTDARVQRALDAMVAIIECEETSWSTKRALDAACDALRSDRANGLVR